jgi:hypothetical protein
MKITPPLLGPALSLQCGLCFFRCGVRDAARLPCPSDSAPFAHEAPNTKEVRLHVHPVIAVHMLRAVDAIEGDGIHALSLEIVLWLTL